jgi:hypothetical protein
MDTFGLIPVHRALTDFINNKVNIFPNPAFQHLAESRQENSGYGRFWEELGLVSGAFSLLKKLSEMFIQLCLCILLPLLSS